MSQTITRVKFSLIPQPMRETESVTMRNFFIGWPASKVAELAVVVYMMAVGLLFMAVPSTLRAPIYDGWKELYSQAEWGLLMCLVALGHAFALWLNGRVWWSCVVRLIASGVHLSVTVTFMLLFVAAGVMWGAVTYLFVSGVVFLGAMAGVRAIAGRYLAWTSKSSRPR